MSRLQRFTGILIALFLVGSQLVAQEKFVVPKLSDPNSWTMILVPDTQTYDPTDANVPENGLQ